MIITNVMAASVDGLIAASPDEPDEARRAASFTNEDDYQHLLAQLSQADAVVVGGSSLMATGGVIEVAGLGGAMPLWVVSSNRGIPPGARFWSQRAVPRWIASRAPLAPVEGGEDVRNLVVGQGPLAGTIVEALRAAGKKRVALLGGGELNRSFYEEGLVHELILTVCPLVIGAANGVPLVRPPLSSPVRLTLHDSQAKGDLVFLKYKIRQS